MKIFNLSLNRTGTTSLQKAITLLGFKSLHDIFTRHIQPWRDGKEPILAREIEEFDALTAGLGWFGSDIITELLKSHPDARYILVRRDLGPWLDSWDYYKTLATTDHILKGSPYRPMIKTSQLIGIWYQHRDLLRKLNIPNLLDIKLEQLTWSTLAPFLDKPTPNAPFPRINTSPRKLQRVSIKVDSLREAHIIRSPTLGPAPAVQSFAHFVLTRYNMGLYRGPRRLRPEPKKNMLLTPEGWMWHRYWLFREFCLPSVLSQNIQGFTWIIFVDPKTPGRQLKHINALLPQNAHTIKATNLDEISKFVKSRSSDAEYTLTTMLDNDDMLREDAVGSIQAAASELIEKKQPNSHCIDIPAGYMADEDLTKFSECELATRREPKRTSFVSYLSKGPSKTNALKYGTLCNLPRDHLTFLNDRLWMRIIHMANLSNQLMGTRCEPPDGFGIEIKIKAPTESSGA